MEKQTDIVEKMTKGDKKDIKKQSSRDSLIKLAKRCGCSLMKLAKKYKYSLIKLAKHLEVRPEKCNFAAIIRTEKCKSV